MQRIGQDERNCNPKGVTFEMVVAQDPDMLIALPYYDHQGRVPLERVLSERHSVRDFRREAVSLVELGQLLWAAQSINSPAGMRTAPSVGALRLLQLDAGVRTHAQDFSDRRSWSDWF